MNIYHELWQTFAYDNIILYTTCSHNNCNRFLFFDIKEMKCYVSKLGTLNDPVAWVPTKIIVL